MRPDQIILQHLENNKGKKYSQVNLAKELNMTLGIVRRGLYRLSIFKAVESEYRALGGRVWFVENVQDKVH